MSLINYQNLVLKEIKNNNWEGVFMIVQNTPLTFPEFTAALNPSGTEKKWTILQYACDIDEEEEATYYVTEIFETLKRWPYSIPVLDTFVNYNEPNDDKSENPAALHIAISKKYGQVVKQLLQNAADVLLPEPTQKRGIFSYLLGKFKQDHIPMVAIYEQYHTAMIHIFDKNCNLAEGKFKLSNDAFSIVEYDFTPVTGFQSVREEGDNNKDYLRETRLLARVLGQERKEQSETLLHPLIQIYLFMKREKLKWFIRTSVLYHVIWSFLSIAFIIFHTKIAVVGESSVKTNCNEDDDRAGYSFEHWLPIYIIMGLFYAVTLIKEFIELRSSPNKNFYLWQKENWGQWILLFVVPCAAIEPYTNSAQPRIGTIYSLVYIGGILTAALLVQAQSTKIEYFGVYNQMFSRILRRFRDTFLMFSPLLISFMLIFWLLLPEASKFKMNRMFGLVKVTSMMAGEITLDETVNSSDTCLLYPVATDLLLFLFVIIITIILSNLLIGLTVNDLNELKGKKCKVHHLATTLEVICLIEHFLTSCLIIGISRNILRSKNYPCNYLVGPAKRKLLKELGINDSNAKAPRQPEASPLLPMSIEVPEDRSRNICVNLITCWTSVKDCIFGPPQKPKPEVERQIRLMDLPKDIRDIIKNYEKAVTEVHEQSNLPTDGNVLAEKYVP